MYTFKKGVNKLEESKSLMYVISNNINTCLCMSSTLDAYKPYNGMYIKDGKVIIENIVEKIEYRGKAYKLVQVNTGLQNVSCDEYITSIDLMNSNFEYNVGNVSYTKKIAFKKNSDILCIEYNIVNDEQSQIRFKVIPLLTYRELFNMKNFAALKFTQRKIENGTVINLSVMNQDNLVIKSKELNYIKDLEPLNNVKHDFIEVDSTKTLYNEDLAICAEFETIIKANQSKKIRIYFASEEFSLEKLEEDNIFKQDIETKKEASFKILDEFVELKDLAISINNLNLKEKMINTLPYKKSYDKSLEIINNEYNIKQIIEDIEALEDITKSIEGQYITFSKCNEAAKVLEKIKNYIILIENLKIDYEEVFTRLTVLKLWYIESANRFLQKENNVELFIEFTQKIVYDIMNSPKKSELYKDIEVISLMFNALKIYENMLAWKNNIEDNRLNEEMRNIEILLENKFWIEDKRIMKRNLDDSDHYANVKMIYTLSLSYPCVIADIPIKLLDTIFKELYTPYGLREISKQSTRYNGNIYPKYMAGFVKANLRQNGVTRASQKISYNLVKELFSEIGKYVNGGVKKIYNDKGIAVDSIGYDLLTNAEMIRLYNMLT